jgi:23S rRNA pseudouridine2605 synthase
MKERVQKLIAQANLASRRGAEDLIRQGRVAVNGKTIQLGDQADPAVDTITVDGTRLKVNTNKRYFALNKPQYVVSSNVSQDERDNARELLPVEGHFFTVGRLDAESDGLMIFTNDGELANQLSHPRYEHTKTYKVVVYGDVTQETLDQWEKGVFLEEGLTAPCSIRVQQRDADVTVLRIVMIEGKKRQIRRIAAILSHPVKRLTRTHIGKLEVGKLKPGEWRELGAEDLELLTTPASDLSYIRRLRRDQRAIKRRDYRSQQLAEQNSASRQALSELEAALNRTRAGSKLRVSRVSSDRDEESDERGGRGEKPRRSISRRPGKSSDSESKSTGDRERTSDSRPSGTGAKRKPTDRKPVGRRPAGQAGSDTRSSGDRDSDSRPSGTGAKRKPVGRKPAGRKPSRPVGRSNGGSGSKPGGRKPGSTNRRPGSTNSRNNDNRRSSNNDKRRSSR